MRSVFQGRGMTAAAAEPLDAGTLQGRGDTERDRANWPAAAYFYASVLKRRPDDAPIWMQYGHALKESGLFAEAQKSYERVIELSPTDAEARLQLAILLKIRGDFAGATAMFTQAQGLGYQPADFVTGEIQFLRKTDGRPVRRAALSGSVSAGQARIILSSVAVRPPESDGRNLKAFLGATHYSYAYAMMGFHDALRRAGYACEIIRNPEYVADIRDGAADACIHLGFYPPDGPRYLKGAYNIMCVAWEFERLKTAVETLSYHAFADAAKMLSRSQEIWATSDFGAEAFRRSDLANVSTVSTPIVTGRPHGRHQPPNVAELRELAMRLDAVTWVPLGIWHSMQPSLDQHTQARSRSLLNLLIDAEEDEPPTLFLSVFNVHDFRKQIKPLIEGFVRFAQERPRCYLLLKINCVDGDNTTINDIMFQTQFRDEGEMWTIMVSDNVLLTTETLSRDEMNDLYDAAAFYVCTSHAEGQNLPQLEAMGRGVVPISVDHTAMRDYISPDNAIVLPSHYRPMTPRLAARYGMFGVGTYYVSGRDVFQALVEAHRLTPERYAGLSGAAVETVASRFGLGAFRVAIDRAMDRSRADLDHRPA